MYEMRQFKVFKQINNPVKEYLKYESYICLLHTYIK